MSNRLRSWLEAVGDLFWLRPACLVALGVLLGEIANWAERAGIGGSWSGTSWVYSGGEAGARALLGAVAASTIGVAGTTFSITVAALSLASGQMGPRLLRNFTRDSGNQWAFGIFLGTFAYALVVLRMVRSAEEGSFVPHLGVSGAMFLALLCIAALIWFVHHVANGINVEVVIELVQADLRTAIDHLTLDQAGEGPAEAPPPGSAVALEETGYVRALDEAALADWARDEGVVLVLLIRPGDYLFPGAPVAEISHEDRAVDAARAIRQALAVGTRQAATQDLEFAVRQLVEVAVRALSPGVNDPFTAIAVIDRLGATLCQLASRHLPASAVRRDDRVVLHRRTTDYPGLCDAMFHMIRQNAAGSAAVLIRLLETLARVMPVEMHPERRAVLRRHAALVAAAGEAGITDAAGLHDLRKRHAGFQQDFPEPAATLAAP